MRSVRTALFLATLAAAIPPAAGQTTAPASPRAASSSDAPAMRDALPIDPMAAVAKLSDRDPLVREAGRSELMSIDAAHLPALRDALAARTLSPGEAAVVREAVLQVYLTGKHRFVGGGNGFLGVSTTGGTTESPTINWRMIGWDAYRALRDGDTIVGVRRPNAPADEAFVPIRNFTDLAARMRSTRPGERIVVRVLRDGTARDVELRLAQSQQPVQVGTDGTNRFAEEAERYWEQEFAPALSFVPLTTRPVE